MSLAIWPPVPPEELERKKAEALKNELVWITAESLDSCRDLKRGLEDCYALLAPVDPGSTLVMSTPRNEKVKGTITRVGTRIVKGTLNLQLRTAPAASSLTITPSQPIYIPALESLHTHLSEAVSLLEVTISQQQQQPPDAATLASSLALLAESLDAASALLKGRPLTESDPTWQTASCPAQHFSSSHPPSSSSSSPSLPNTAAAAAASTKSTSTAANAVSFHLAIHESCVVLWLRVLEPANAPVNLGVKIGLAIGTVRRLEHDEMDTVFTYHPEGDGSTLGRKNAAGGGDRGRDSSSGSGVVLSGNRNRNVKAGEPVHVREKVRVVSADPSLISLYSKLGYLSHILGQTRRNLAAVLESFPQS